MVHDDHQRPARRLPRERDHLPGLGIEPPGQLVGHGRRVGGCLRVGDGDRAGRVGAQAPHAVLGTQPQPEDRMRGHDGVRGAFDVLEPGALGRHQRPGLGEPGQ